MARIWVDYSDADNGRCTTLTRFAKGELAVGSRVLTYDFDGHESWGTVESMDETFVVIALDDLEPVWEARMYDERED